MSDKTSDDADLDAVFKALASPTRRSLMDLLKRQPQTTGQLCAAMPELDRCTVMQHLAVLTDAGVVVAHRRGRERWNHLNVVPIVAIQRRWLDDYSATATGLLGDLAERV